MSRIPSSNAFFVLAALLCSPLFLTGCSNSSASQSVAVEVPAEREQFMLKQVPASFTTIGVAQENLETDQSIVVKGWADLEYLETGNQKAVFMVREILDDHDHGGEGHDPSSCVFCRRRMNAAPKAPVAFVGQDNKALPYPIGQLFPIKHGDEVVVTGTGKFDEGLDLLKITAESIYLPASMKDSQSTDQPTAEQHEE